MIFYMKILVKKMFPLWLFELYKNINKMTPYAWKSNANLRNHIKGRKSQKIRQKTKCNKATL
jgi:hypothetical protein